MVEEYVADASKDLLFSISHLGGPSSVIPLSHEAATSDLPRSPPHGEGHLPELKS